MDPADYRHQPILVTGLYSKTPARGRASFDEMGLKTGFIRLLACLSSWEVKLLTYHLSCLCRSGFRSRLSCA